MFWKAFVKLFKFFIYTYIEKKYTALVINACVLIKW